MRHPGPARQTSVRGLLQRQTFAHVQFGLVWSNTPNCLASWNMFAHCGYKIQLQVVNYQTQIFFKMIWVLLYCLVVFRAWCFAAVVFELLRGNPLQGCVTNIQTCCREILEKGVVKKCWGRVLLRRVGEGCCREVLEKRVEQTKVEMCWKSVLQRSVAKECWRKAFQRRVRREFLFVFVKKFGEEHCREVLENSYRKEVLKETVVEKCKSHPSIPKCIWVSHVTKSMSYVNMVYGWTCFRNEGYLYDLRGIPLFNDPQHLKDPQALLHNFLGCSPAQGANEK